MKTLIAAVIFAAVLLGTGALPAAPAAGREVLAHYEARLSKRDHVSSKGKRLTSAAAVLQRDREHLFLANEGRSNEFSDLEDNRDDYFVSRERLNGFEAALTHGRLDAATAKKIVTGTPLVDVTVYRDADGSVAVDVKFLRGGEAVVEEVF